MNNAAKYDGISAFNPTIDHNYQYFMTSEIIIRYLHFLGILTLFAALVSEHLLLGKTMKRSQLARVSILDGIYGIAVLVALISGLLLWFVVGKPAELYTQNAVFHTKILLFVIIALISIHPTLFFLKNRKGPAEEEITLPKSIIMVVRMELLLLATIPLLATLMAKGVGYFGG